LEGIQPVEKFLFKEYGRLDCDHEKSTKGKCKNNRYIK